ncbi:hypothetical protein SAMN05421538_105153 [Paracoccus isoporae]|uniref:Methyltransferase domain-containing protein n=1 Tax=Paracoccus isoporae TaxID=591205 RepID=A0A1G7BNT0_9RHOB|nr:hypothetical protein [Paracoccus isoporae]SDE28613.1 hypothetical protein SAMN05421538_105153 [Paracoccus isoporae]
MATGWRKKLRAIKTSAQENDFVDEGAYKLAKYVSDGEFSYEKYREIQTIGNKAKIGNQWVPEEHICILARILSERHPGPVRYGVCHGTRRGKEQEWFEKYLADGADVFGTEISDTATDFPKTIQWDFHERKAEWEGRFDFIYSNSWDHTYDPKLLFTTWASCLNKNGYLMIDHGWNYDPDRVDLLDAFGISETNLITLLNRECAEFGQVEDVIDGGHHKRLPIRTILFKALS